MERRRKRKKKPNNTNSNAISDKNLFLHRKQREALFLCVREREKEAANEIVVFFLNTERTLYSVFYTMVKTER